MEIINTYLPYRNTGKHTPVQKVQHGNSYNKQNRTTRSFTPTNHKEFMMKEDVGNDRRQNKKRVKNFLEAYRNNSQENATILNLNGFNYKGISYGNTILRFTVDTGATTSVIFADYIKGYKYVDSKDKIIINGTGV